MLGTLLFPNPILINPPEPRTANTYLGLTLFMLKEFLDLNSEKRMIIWEDDTSLTMATACYRYYVCPI